MISPPVTRRAPSVLAACALAACVAILYGPTLRHPFVYDDHLFIVKNLTLRSWGEALGSFARAESVSDSELTRAIYRPLAVVSLRLDLGAWGLEPAGFHLTNVLLHAANAAGAGLVARSFGLGQAAAWLTAFLFAVHPIQTEVVCWPSSRPEALFTFFFLWAWAGREWLRGRGRNLAAEAWALPLFAGALLAKEMAVTFPLLLALREAWLPPPGGSAVAAGAEVAARQGGSRALPASAGGARPASGPAPAVGGRAALRRALLRAAPYALLAVAYFAWRTHVLGGLGAREQRAETAWLNLLTMSIVFVRYMGLTLWPAGQNVEHTVRVVSSPFDAAGLAALAGLALCLGAALAAVRRRPAVGFGLVWWLAALLPVSNLIPIWSLMAERFLYLPSLGLFAAGAALLLEGARRGRAARLGAAGVLVAACAAVTGARVPVWADEIRFWDDVVAKSPERRKSHNNRGEALLRQGRLQEAEEAFRRALALEPLGPMAHFNLGRLAQARGELGEAEARFRQALAANPDLVDAWKGLGDVRLQAGAAGEALRAYREFLARRDDPVVRYNLAVVLYNQGDLQAAGEEAGRAAELDPRLPGPHRILGLVAQKLGRNEEAEGHYRRALAIEPAPDVLYNVAQLAMERQDYAAAATDFARARALAPRSTEVALRQAQAEILRDLRGRARPEALRALRTGEAREHAAAATLLRGLPDLEGIAARLEPARRERGSSKAQAAVLATLALLERARGRLAEARALYEELLEAGADPAAAHLAIGEMAAQAGDAASAERHLRRALSLDPALPQAHARLAFMARLRGEPAAALELYTRALAAAPAHPASLDGRCEALHDLQRWTEARRCFEERVLLVPDHPQAHYYLGRLYRRLGDPERARAEFARHEEIRRGRGGAPGDTSASLE